MTIASDNSTTSGTIARNLTVDDAIGKYPELARLFELMSQTRPQWRFRLRRHEGYVTGLMGTRVWPELTEDTIGIRSQTEARAVRLDPHRNRVFEVVDTLAVVVDKVLEHLVDPIDQQAPRVELRRVLAGGGPWPP